MLASIGVEEVNWLDGVGVGKVDADGNKIRPEKENQKTGQKQKKSK